MEFEINQIFDGEYPPEAALWCNENNAYINEIEAIDGVRRFQIVAIPEPTQEEIEAQTLVQSKQERAEAVSKIIVEVDGMAFDGDEDSQTRMSRTITASQALGLPEDTTISWAMADTNPNKVEQVTVKQLAQALYLAGLKQSELWVKPYGVEQTVTSQTGLEYLNSLGQ